MTAVDWNLQLHMQAAARRHRPHYTTPPARARGPSSSENTRELATKVGYFGVKSANVIRDQMGTKPAKVGRLASGVLKCGAVPQHSAPTGASAKRSSLCGTSKVAKVGSGRGSNLLKSDPDRRRRLTKRVSLHKKVFAPPPRGRTKVAKVGPRWARGQTC